MSKLVAVNLKGRRVGEDNPSAKLTNNDIDLVFVLHEQGLGYNRISRKLEVSKALIQKIIKGLVRSQQPARFKRCA